VNNPHSHQNARLGVAGGACLAERVLHDGWTAPDAAAAFHVSVRTVWKWVRGSSGGVHSRNEGLAPGQEPRVGSAVPAATSVIR
jgi:hypothetical protein